MSSPRRFSDLVDYFDEHDLLLYLSSTSVEQRFGESIREVAAEVLDFLGTRELGDLPGRYLARTQELQALQEAFEASGRYAASSYAEVALPSHEDYQLALLLSFVLTHHRFEILLALKAFLASPVQAPRRLLSVGFGTGYELKVAQELCPDWQIDAYDSSRPSYEYARALLSHFEKDVSGLREEHFPLEDDTGLALHEGRYGRVVLCEVLEHLESPLAALRNLGRCLADGGRFFLTMAIRIAQEDHIFLYDDIASAREQVADAGLEIEREWIAPMTIRPVEDEDREASFKRGNYVCVARRPAG